MSDRESRPRGRELPDLEAMAAQIVAESLSSSWASSDDPSDVWRRRGSQQTIVRTISDLDKARTDTRALLEGSPWDDGNEFAIGAAENRQDYVIGDSGFTYEAVPAAGVAPEPELLRETQRFIDLFGELNDLPSMEAESVLRLDRDGDVFARLFDTGDIPEVRFIQPERIYPPADDSPARASGEHADCSDEWGIVHDRKDRCRVAGYWVDEGEGYPEFVPEREICHLKLTTSEWPRGWPTFEPVRRSLVRAEEVLVAMTATGKARAKIALITTIPGWTAAKAEALLARLTSKYQDQPSGEVPRSESVEELPYGAHMRVREGTTIQFPPPGLGAAELVEAIQANLRTAGARLRMPEWMFSGMADQKYSNAFVVEAPSLKMFKGIQRRVVNFFGAGRMGSRASLLWRAIRIAVRRGILNPNVLHAVQIKVSAPSLESRDKGAEASANSTYINDGVKSRETVQEEIGLDPAREKARVEAEGKVFGLAGKRSALQGGGEPPGGPAPPPTPAPPAEPPIGEALARLVGKWIAEGGVARAGDGTFPDSDHFGLTDAGERWVSESLYALVAEADRKGLVQKEIEYTRGGKRYKRKQWVRAGDPVGQKPGHRPEQSFEAVADAIVQPHLADPRRLTANLHSLTDEELDAVRGNTPVPKGARGDVIRGIVGHVQRRADEVRRGAKATPATTSALVAATEVAAKPPVKRDVNLGADPLPKSKAKVEVPSGYGAEPDQRIAETFGRKSSEENRAALSASVGMPDDAQLHITHYGEFRKKFSDDSPKKGARGVRVEVPEGSHPSLGRVSRFVGVDGKGKRFIRNEILEVKDRGGGLGTEIFRKQIESASAEGVDYIETHAVGRWNSSYNGYYTWPQFGYNAPVRPGEKWAPVKAAFPGAKSVQDVMDAPRANVPPEEVKRISDELNKFDAKRGKPPKERQHITGEEWWKVNGFELTGMKFDLRPGSRSMRKFAAYLAKKQAAPKAAPNPTAPPPT